MLYFTTNKIQILDLNQINKSLNPRTLESYSSHVYLKKLLKICIQLYRLREYKYKYKFNS